MVMQTNTPSPKLIGIVRGIAGNRYKADIRAETRLVEDLGFDSVMAIRTMLEIQKVFNVDVAAHSDQINVAEIITVQDLQSLVERFSHPGDVNASGRM